MNEVEDKTITVNGILKNICELDCDGEVGQLVLDAYDWIRQGKSFGEIRRMADKKVAEKVKNVI